MAEMFSWYIDNSKYFTKEFSKMIIDYSIEATQRGLGITSIVEEHNPTVGNKSSNVTAARDFGIIDNNSSLADGSVLFLENVYNYENYVLDLISKRNVSKSK